MERAHQPAERAPCDARPAQPQGYCRAGFDLRCQFSGADTEVSASHVVIIVALVDRLIGILVDAVSDILTLEPGDIMPVPKTGSDLDQDFLDGLVSKDDRMIALLQLEGLFNIDA